MFLTLLQIDVRRFYGRPRTTSTPANVSLSADSLLVQIRKSLSFPVRSTSRATIRSIVSRKFLSYFKNKSAETILQYSEHYHNSWNIRIVNEAGDFNYVTKSEVEVKLQKMRRWAEYERTEEGVFTKLKSPEHWEIVFRLRRKRGVKSQLPMTVTAD